MLNTSKIQQQLKGSIIKREWWQVWEKEDLPPLEHVIQSYDTAFMKKETADYSAITTWGVFHPSEDSGPGVNSCRYG
jgi:phage terminase large subunit-like protein